MPQQAILNWPNTFTIITQDIPQKIIILIRKRTEIEKNLLHLLEQRYGEMYQMSLKHVLFLFSREK